MLRNFGEDKTNCLKALEIFEIEKISSQSSVAIRRHLRNTEFKKWFSLRTHGKGVVLYQECPFANRWLATQKGLSSSEYKDAIKLQGNVAPVRALHGRSQDGHRCRHCRP